jgi:hypothetical protein
MATVTPTVTRLLGDTDLDGYLVVWGPMQNGDTGTFQIEPGFADRSVQVTGTFGAGGTVAIEGSNDGVNGYVLNTPFGVALNITQASIEEILEATWQIRPHVVSGDGTTSVIVSMLARRTR